MNQEESGMNLYRSCAVVGVSVVCALAAILGLPGEGKGSIRPGNEPSAAHAEPAVGGFAGNARTPPQVAQLLDCIAQPRFKTVDGMFGMSRLITVEGHSSLAGFEPRDPRETDLMRRVNRAELPYITAFLHCTHAAGHFKNGPIKYTRGPIKYTPFLSFLFAGNLETGGAQPQRVASPGVRLYQLERSTWDRAASSVQAAADHALPRLMKGHGAEADSGPWLVVMRPVRALSPGCIGCHTTARIGDTLGAMVYVVSKRMPPS